MSVVRVGLMAALVAALGIYLYLYELPKVEREAAEGKLVAVDSDAVSGLTLTFPDRRLALERQGEDWRLTEPVQGPADTTQVKSLLTSITSAKVTKTLEDLPDDLADFGLVAPSPIVEMRIADGEPITLRVGRNTAIGAKTYVQVGAGPDVRITQTNLKVALNKQVKDLRDKQVITFDDADVTRVEITSAATGSTTLTRKGDDAWTVDPGGHVGDKTEISSYLSSLRSTRAVDFAEDAPTELASYGLDTPVLSVSVHTDDETPPATLLLGGERTDGTTTQIYAKRASREQVVLLGQWSLRSLDKTVADFRDKTVLAFAPDRVAEVVLERGNESGFIATRAADGWRIDGAEGAVDQAAIDRLLTDLRDLRGSGIAAEPAGDLAAFGLDAPALSITLTDVDGEPMGTVLATEHGDTHYAMVAGSDVVFETRDYMYTRLDKTLSDVVTTPPAAAD